MSHPYDALRSAQPRGPSLMTKLVQSRAILPFTGLIALLALITFWKRSVANPGAACERGSPWACTRIGHAYQDPNAFGVEADWAKAAELYRKGCVGGDLEGCLFLARMVEEAPDARGGDGVAVFIEGCRAGEPAFCDALGLSHEAGRGVARDLVEAAKLWRDACAGGFAPSCVRLGRAYDLGLGVEQDHEAAVAYLGKGCMGGRPDACRNVADHYAKGVGVPQDLAVAARLEDAACWMLQFGAFTPRHAREQKKRYCGEMTPDELELWRAKERQLDAQAELDAARAPARSELDAAKTASARGEGP